LFLLTIFPLTHKREDDMLPPQQEWVTFLISGASSNGGILFAVLIRTLAGESGVLSALAAILMAATNAIKVAM
jgi:hypothetical protein